VYHISTYSNVSLFEIISFNSNAESRKIQYEFYPSMKIAYRNLKNNLQFQNIRIKKKLDDFLKYISYTSPNIKQWFVDAFTIKNCKNVTTNFSMSVYNNVKMAE
jgi:hypothetical protein